MITKRASPWGTAVMCTALVCGCGMSVDTRDQLVSGGLGALTGAAIGAAASGGNPRAVVAGATAGAVTGWAAVKLVQYQARKTKEAQSENEILGYRAGDPLRIKMRELTVEPSPLRAGSEATITTRYGLAGPPSARARVTETVEIRDARGKVIVPPSPRDESRTPGGWESPTGLPLPKSAPRGTYTVIARVDTGTSHDEARTTLTVQ